MGDSGPSTRAAAAQNPHQPNSEAQRDQEFQRAAQAGISGHRQRASPKKYEADQPNHNSFPAINYQPSMMRCPDTTSCSRRRGFGVELDWLIAPILTTFIFGSITELGMCR